MWTMLAVSLAMSLIAHVIAPRPKRNISRRPPQEIQAPTVDAGRPVPVIFGRRRVKSPNIVTMGGQHSSEVRK